jgi:flagellar biosynthesis protein FlhF
MPDALQKIRTDLGNDAVILNTKEIRTGGFLGLFGKRRIEVIAATDANTGGASVPAGKQQAAIAAAAVLKTVKRAAPSPAGPSPILAGLSQEGEPIITPISPVSPVPAPATPTASAAPPAQELSAAVPPLPAESAPLVASATASSRYAAHSVPSSAPPPVSAAPPNNAAKPGEDMLMQEIKQMKEMMSRLSEATQRSIDISLGDDRGMSDTLLQLEARLLEQEMDPTLVREILEQARNDSADNQIAAESAGDAGEAIDHGNADYAAVRQVLLQRLSSQREKSLSPETKVAHFVGPTGVGKTTTIAKLAAEQVLKHQRKVGFITSDTYRIAAVEQLKTYATILNIPLEVVFSPQDLNRAFQKFADRDVIFMDTAGRNFRNEMYVSELNALLSTHGNAETFLVLSMTMKYRDMKAVTENFLKFGLDKVLFTKMDETDSYGPIVNLVNHYPLQLSYMANGQSVPDDIAVANEERIVDLLLEGNGHG